MVWKDRVPTEPNRKKITFEDDDSVRYAIIEYADEPVEEGTALNKANIENYIYQQTTPAVGYYTGNGGTQEIEIGFKPKVLLIRASEHDPSGSATTYTIGSNMVGMFTGNGVANVVEITANGFVAKNTKIGLETSNINNYNRNAINYVYVAWR